MNSPTDKEEFFQRLAQCQSELFGYIFALLRDLHDTEDVHQQTLITLWQKADDFQPGSNFMGWAIRVAQIEVLRFREKQKSTAVKSEKLLVDLAAEYLRASSAGILSDRKEALTGCLQKLPAQDREVIDLCYLGNCKMKDVADKLGRSRPSLSKMLKRIRSVLMSCIERSLAVEHHP